MKTQEKKQKVQRINKKVKEESLSYTVEVRDKDGRVLQRVSAPSRSYVQQWNQLINAHAAQATKTVKDTEGTLRSAPLQLWTPFTADAGIGQITRSIVIGKGTTAVAITDYALENICGQGTGTDEFEYQATEWVAPQVVGSTCSFITARTMINNSLATITGIREIGCYGVFYSGDYRYAMLFRDVLLSALEVPYGGAITVYYTIKATV